MVESVKKVLMLLGNYSPATHRGIVRAAHEFGWYLNVSMLSSFQIPMHWAGDGILCSLNDNEALFHFVTQSSRPCVDLSMWRTEWPLPRVAADNEEIGRMAGRLFSAYGHRHVAWFSHSDNPVANARFEGLCSTIQHPIERLVGPITQHREAVLTWLAQLPAPCGLFAFNDSDAAWLLTLCLEGGYSIPEHFAILGVDNDPLVCEHQPVPLSSVNHDLECIGYEGACLLQRLMKGEVAEPLTRRILPKGVTQRASTDAYAVSDPLVRAALDYLQRHLHQSIGTTDVAAALGVSRRTLEQRFRALFGCGIHQKLVEMRLHRVETLLRTTPRKMEDIAAETGFCHAPHLCNLFKRRHGLSPLAYRKALTATL